MSHQKASVNYKICIWNLGLCRDFPPRIDTSDDFFSRNIKRCSKWNLCLCKCIHKWVHSLHLQVSFNSLSGNQLNVIVHFIYFRNNICFTKSDMDIPIGKHGLQWTAVNCLEMYFNWWNETRLLLTHCLIYLLQWWHEWALRKRLEMRLNLMYTRVKFASLNLS